MFSDDNLYTSSGATPSPVAFTTHYLNNGYANMCGLMSSATTFSYAGGDNTTFLTSTEAQTPHCTLCPTGCSHCQEIFPDATAGPTTVCTRCQAGYLFRSNLDNYTNAGGDKTGATINQCIPMPGMGPEYFDNGGRTAGGAVPDWQTFIAEPAFHLMRPCADDRCVSCGSNYRICTECTEGFLPNIAGKCVANPYHGYTGECGPGYFWDAANNQCDTCAAHCQFCSSKMSCLKPSDYYTQLTRPDGSTDVSVSCVDGKFVRTDDNGVCTVCSEDRSVLDCAFASGTNMKSLTQCADDASAPGTAPTSCPVKFDNYPDNNPLTPFATPSPVTDNCAAYTSTNDQCSHCNYPFYLADDFSCKCATGEGFWTPATTTDCLKCPTDNCKVCDSGVCT